jgi:hypothetical protein
MKIKTDYNYHARPHGGLFAGIRIHFPATLCDDDDINKTWRNITIQIGLFVVTLNFRIEYAHQYVKTN